jgi:hypothetical protein
MRYMKGYTPLGGDDPILLRPLRRNVDAEFQIARRFL